MLSGVLLSNKFITKQNLGSIYNIDEAGDNFDNIQIGDSINYEVNGYSDWQVIGKDDYEGTIDVVSKTNTEDLTLEYGQSKEYYENKFQETANKYIDNNYAISARTVNSSDLDYFNYDNDFWLNNTSDKYITTSQSIFEINPNHKIYVIPYVRYSVHHICEEGSVIDYSYNGIDKWVVLEYIGHEYDYPDSWDNHTIVPETPIELVIDNIDEDINEKYSEIMGQFNNNNYLSRYGERNLSKYLSNFFNQQTEKIYFISNCNYYKENNLIKDSCGGSTYFYENGSFGYTNTIYTDTSVPYTLGYRPVLTLKVKKEVKEEDKKEISSKLKVGDNVKYEAKGYKNWKVLGIDNDLGTVDIISGGIVKNLTLSGKEDWDSYENTIQREVNEYKNGNQAKKATTVTSSTLKTLKEIDKSILTEYWILSKGTFISGKKSFGEKNADIINYHVNTVKLYKKYNYEIFINNISLYSEMNGDKEVIDYYSDLFRNMEYNYTAGLRPVITLKLDSVEKLPEDETKKIEESTEKQEKVFIKEQESKNKDYKGPSKVDNSTSSTGNNNEVKSNDKDNAKDNIIDNNTSNVEKIVYKDKPFYKYGFIIFLMTSIIELIIILLLLKKIKR